MPLVNIVLPVYNGEKYIVESIESILKQTQKDFELLIVDDGSTDQTVNKIDSIRDSRIKLHQNGINRGLIFSLNHGIHLTSDCKYIARMDADDIAIETRLDLQTNFLDNFSDYGVLGTAITHFDSRKKEQNKYFPTTNEYIRTALLCKNPMAHPTVMFRSNLKNHIIYDTNFPKYEDYALWIKLLNITKFHNLTYPLLKYRRHTNNITNTYSEHKEKDHQVFCRLIESYSQVTGINLHPEQIELISTISAKSRYLHNPSVSIGDIQVLISQLGNEANIGTQVTYLKDILIGKALVYLLYFSRFQDILKLTVGHGSLASLHRIYRTYTNTRKKYL